MIRHPIEHASAWTGASLEGKTDLIIELERHHLDAFARTIDAVRSRGLARDEVGRQDFPLDDIEATFR